MDRPASYARSLIVCVALILLLLLVASDALAGGTPRNVLVVENILSSESKDIASYYMAARGIPTSNLCRIRCSTSEIVSRTEYETNILGPIWAFLQAYEVNTYRPELANQIDYIVLTKGIPLGANGYPNSPMSITSMLTCVGRQPAVTTSLENPYGPAYSTETAFSHNQYNIYLVTRLDAYTVQDVYAMIDHSFASSPIGPILLDATGPGTAGRNKMIMDANTLLLSRGIPTIYDNTTAFIGGGTGLMGYFSWGCNDASYTHAVYVSNTFAPGSIADTIVSTSGRTFDDPTAGGQSLIADLIGRGACGVNGYVSEPQLGSTSFPKILFDRYTKGYNLAESFYAACPTLFWKGVVVGDPLMAPYATIPQVTAEFPQNPLTGSAILAATASDPQGIKRVDFYLDGKYVDSCTSEPYSIQVDTTKCFVGTHRVNVLAVENGPVASEGMDSASVNIVNPISVLGVISDALPCADEQGVECSEKIVTASTADMGGEEFYVQEASGFSGIRVISETPVEEGDLVFISGALVTDSGERSIRADLVDRGDQLVTPLKPIGMSNKQIGGGNFSANTKGVTGGVGLRNIGLLIKTWGKTTYIGGMGEDFFYIDDGSALDDGSGHVGIKVKCHELLKPALDTPVVVTGISSCEEVGERIIPVIKVRRQSDVRG